MVEQEERYEIHINLFVALGEVALALLRVACWDQYLEHNMDQGEGEGE